MDAKQYLFNIRNEWKEICILQERIAALSASLLPAGIAYDKDKVQTSPSDPMSERMVEIADYQSQLERQINGLLVRHVQAQSLINMLEDSRERQILGLYFLHTPPKQMNEVAAIVGYSREHTYRIFEQAIANLRKNVTQPCDIV